MIDPRNGTDPVGLSASQMTALATTSLVSACLSFLGALSIVCVLWFTYYRKGSRRRAMSDSERPCLDTTNADSSTLADTNASCDAANVSRTASDRLAQDTKMPGDTPIVLQLSIADLLTALGVAVGSIMYLTGNELQSTTCLAIGAWTATFYVCTFLFTFLYAVRLYLWTRDAARYRKVFLKPLSITCYLAWIVPPALIFSFAGTGLYGVSSSDNAEASWCYPVLHQDSQEFTIYSVLVFEIPLLLVMIGNTILFALTVRQYHRRIKACGEYTNRQRFLERKLVFKVAGFMLVFFFCWTPFVALCCYLLVHPDTNLAHLFPLYLTQTLCAPLQGALNCLVYGWLSSKLEPARRQLRLALSRPSDTYSLRSNPAYPASYRTFEPPHSSVLAVPSSYTTTASLTSSPAKPHTPFSDAYSY